MGTHNASQYGRCICGQPQQPSTCHETEAPWQRKGEYSEYDTPHLVAFHLFKVNAKPGKEHDEEQSHAAEELYLGGYVENVEDSRSYEHARYDETRYLRKSQSFAEYGHKQNKRQDHKTDPDAVSHGKQLLKTHFWLLRYEDNYNSLIL